MIFEKSTSLQTQCAADEQVLLQRYEPLLRLLNKKV